MQSDNIKGQTSERFIIIGCGSKRRTLVEKLTKQFGEVEIIAPVESRVLRPRRKTKATRNKPLIIDVPLFYEYMAINFEDIKEDWQSLNDMEEVWFILLNVGVVPYFVSRSRLEGFLSGSKEISWEGYEVEFMHGPLTGQRGTFLNGKVLIGSGFLGKVSANVFDLQRVLR